MVNPYPKRTDVGMTCLFSESLGTLRIVLEQLNRKFSIHFYWCNVRKHYRKSLNNKEHVGNV